MYDRGESGTSMEKPGNDFDSYFDAEQHCGGDHFSHGASCGWMPGGGRGRRRAMMMGMMSDPSGVYGMDHGHRFGFGGRGGRRGHGGSWFGFGGRGGRRGHGGSWFGFGDRGQRHEHGGRGRGRNGRGCGRFFVDDDDEYVTSMAEQMDDCHLEEGCKRDGSGSSESSSSSSSESDDDQNAPDVNVQGRQPHDGEVLETEGKTTKQAQQETTKSNATELEKEKASSQHTCNHGKRGCRNGRGHHKHHHGKHKHHRHSAPHHSMIPPPHLLGFNRPTFPPMHHSHHRFPGCHGNRHMAKKFFKKSIRQWVKAQKRAWKQQQESHCCHHHRRQRSDEDEATSGCDNDDDFELPEGRCQLPPPWLFFPYDHHGCGHGRRGFGRHEKKGKKNGKRLRKCNGERPSPAEDTSATKTQVDAVDDVEKVHEVHDESENDQAPMEEAAE